MPTSFTSPAAGAEAAGADGALLDTLPHAPIAVTQSNNAKKSATGLIFVLIIPTSVFFIYPVFFRVVKKLNNNEY